MVLQVVTISDASRPSYGLPGERRMLLLQLTDGRSTVKGVEWRALGQALSEGVAPGTKVRTPQILCSIQYALVVEAERGQALHPESCNW